MTVILSSKPSQSSGSKISVGAVKRAPVLEAAVDEAAVDDSPEDVGVAESDAEVVELVASGLDDDRAEAEAAACLARQQLLAS